MRWSAAPKPLSASREDPRPINQMVEILRNIGARLLYLWILEIFLLVKDRPVSHYVSPLGPRLFGGIQGQFVTLLFHVVRDQLQLRGDVTV